MQQMNARKQSENDTKPKLSSFAKIQQRFSSGGGNSTVSDRFKGGDFNAIMDVEEDPLEAYMQDIEKNAAKQESVADLAIRNGQ